MRTTVSTLLALVAALAAVPVRAQSLGAPAAPTPASAPVSPPIGAPVALPNAVDPSGAAPPAMRAQPAADRSAPSYRIRSNDILGINVYGEPNLSQSVRVLQGGLIGMPLAGQVRVGGLTPEQAGRAVSLKLTKYLRHPQVSVAVVQQAPLEVLVLGNVKTPGKYELQPSSRLTDALAAAGGLGPVDGPYPDVRLATPSSRVRSVSLQQLLQKGDLSVNVALGDQETVYVPSPESLNVQVFGAVDHPGDILVHEGDRLSMAIARAGESTKDNANLNKVSLRRLDAQGRAVSTTINVYEVLNKGDITRDVVLQKNDLIYVPTSPKTVNALNPALSVLTRIFGFGL